MIEPAVERVCPVLGCGRELGVGPTTGAPRLLCPTHWRRVPNRLRLRVVRLSRQVQGGSTSTVWAEFSLAARAAIRAAERTR